MAWQLIYTSAPRLLEAGRSGFGTVARHRDISPLVVSAVERLSQFSRTSGLNLDRVIYSHRIISAAGSSYHVLSCVRDAGADYTGRTNHIAHHLIFEAKEIARLGAKGVSPADVFFRMPWRSTWTETPRYLDASEEVSLDSFGQVPTTGTWAQITGNGENAWLLASGAAARSCYVIAPAGVDLRAVFSESMSLAPEKAWQATLTTSLQPTDDVADFRWIGVESSSPLRAQTETSTRAVLDLSRPHLLPQPDVPAAPVTNPAPSLSGAVSTYAGYPPPPSFETSHRLPTAADDTWESSRKNTGTRASDPFGAASTFGTSDPFAQPVRKAPSIAPKALLITVVAIVLVALGAFFGVPVYTKRKGDAQNKEKIIKVLSSNEYFEPEKYLADVSPELRLQVLAVAEEAVAAAADVEKGNLEGVANERLSRALRDLRKSRALEQGPFLTLEGTIDSINKLQTRLKDWDRKGITGEKLKELVEIRSDIFKIKGMRPAPAEGSITELNKQCEVALAKLYGEIYRDINEVRGGIASYLEWTKPLDPELQNPEAKKAYLRARQLVDDWKMVQETPTNTVATALEATLNAGTSDWPDWLTTMAKETVRESRSGTPSPKTAEVAQSDATDVRTSNAAEAFPVYFVESIPDLSQRQIKEIGSKITYYFNTGSGEVKMGYTGEGADLKLGHPDNVAHSRWFSVSNNKLLEVPGAKDLPSPPFEIVGKDSGTKKTRFSLRVGYSEKEPPIREIPSGFERKDDRLVLSSEAQSLLKLVEPQRWSIVYPVGFDIGGQSARKRDPESFNPPSIDLTKVVQDLQGRRDRFTAEATKAKERYEALLNTAEPDISSLARQARDEFLKVADLDKERKNAIQAPNEVPQIYETLLRTLSHALDSDALFRQAEIIKNNEKDLAKVAAALLTATKAAENRDGARTNEEKKKWDKVIPLLKQMSQYASQGSETAKKAKQNELAKLKDSIAFNEKQAAEVSGHPLLKDGVPPGEYVIRTSVGGTYVPVLRIKIP